MICKKYSTAELVKHSVEPSVQLEEEFLSYQVDTLRFPSCSGFWYRRTRREVLSATNAFNPDEVTVILRSQIESTGARDVAPSWDGRKGD